MKAKKIVLTAVVFVLLVLAFGAGIGFGGVWGYKHAQKVDTRFAFPVCFRTYEALKNGDTNRARFLCGGLLSTYTQQYDSLFVSSEESVAFKNLIAEARQISREVRSNSLRNALETNAAR